jgi:hypothetical protein
MSQTETDRSLPSSAARSYNPAQISVLHPAYAHLTPPATLATSPSAQVNTLPMPMTDTKARTGRAERHTGGGRRPAHHGGRGVRIRIK